MLNPAVAFYVRMPFRVIPCSVHGRNVAALCTRMNALEGDSLHFILKILLIASQKCDFCIKQYATLYGLRRIDGIGGASRDHSTQHQIDLLPVDTHPSLVLFFVKS
eukprot:3321363-Pleurochrysis_carterae.AAC.1